jgi:hypothetical protein
MKIEKIKTKFWMEQGSGGGSRAIGKKIIIYTEELQELTIEEEAKIKAFFEDLRK